MKKKIFLPPTAQTVTSELGKIGSKDKARAKALTRFFKTAEGEYGHGDVFFGVTVPEQRRIAKQYLTLPLTELSKLLESPTHECRLTALLILTAQFKKAGSKEQTRIAKFYLAHSERVNNWDLVDASAPHILGKHLLDNNRSVLYRLARSKNLWERRIAIVATFSFIRAGQFGDTIALAAILLSDTHDLIHKAVGWMLREVGKKSSQVLETFLSVHAHSMPRTMLRYAIEKFPEHKRKKYLSLRSRSR
jgi:3-methyladenine DNA glycosylase AlkD